MFTRNKYQMKLF